jgi:hypothetical protein
MTVVGAHTKAVAGRSIALLIALGSSPEKLSKRDVSQPICSCGWTATWAYVPEKFARDAVQEHVKQVLADLQAVIG